MENIQDFLEKRKNWVKFEDKKNDLTPYFNRIYAKLKLEKPDPFVKQEKDLLKAIIVEIKGDYAIVRANMEVRKKAYFSPLKEIYKMPGCIDELVEQLKSHPTIGMYETDMITQEWNEQDGRKLRKDSFTPEKEIKERDEFLKSKCVEIAKARDEMQQLAPLSREVNGLLQWANCLLYLVMKQPDNKEGSSPSRKKILSGDDDSSSSSSSFDSDSDSDSSSSREDLSYSSRESKRARR